MIEGGYGIEECQALLSTLPATARSTTSSISTSAQQLGRGELHPDRPPTRKRAWAGAVRGRPSRRPTCPSCTSVASCTTASRPSRCWPTATPTWSASPERSSPTPAFVARATPQGRRHPAVLRRSTTASTSRRGGGAGVRLRRQPPTPGASTRAVLPPARRRRARSSSSVADRPGTELAGAAAPSGATACALWERERQPRRPAGHRRAGPGQRPVRRVDPLAGATGMDQLGVDVRLGREATAADVLAAGRRRRSSSPPAPRPVAPTCRASTCPTSSTAAEVLQAGRAPGRTVVVISEDDRAGSAGRGRPPRRRWATRSPSSTRPLAPSPLVGKYTIGADARPPRRRRRDARRHWPASSPSSPASVHAGPHLQRSARGRSRASTTSCWPAAPSRSTACSASCGHRHPEVHLLGDAYAPRRVVYATRQAWSLAAELS